MKHLLLTIFMLVGGLCALEVALRCYRVQSGGDEIAGGRVNVNSLISVPSRSTFLWVAPRLNFEHPSRKSSYRIRTNSFGMRNDEIEVPRDSGLFRILCLGDETTFAAELPERETYCQLLAEELEAQTSTRVEVLNGGCPGGCPTLSALLERHRFLGLQADVIIVHVDPSDLADEETLRRHVERSAHGAPVAAIHPALSGTTGAASRFDDEFLVVRFLRDEAHDLWQRGQAGTSHGDAQGSWGAGVDGPYGEIRSALAAIREMAASQKSAIIISTATAPETKRTSGSRSAESGDARWPPHELTALCDEEELPLVDASAEVAAECRRERSSGAGRLSPAGHAAYAHVLAEEILRTFAEEAAASEDNGPAVRR